MKNAYLILHRISEISLREKSHNGTQWTEIKITDNEGSSFEVSCPTSSDEPPKITYGPDKVAIDDKLASG